MQYLSDRIRLARRAKSWSQAKLAARLGVTTSAVGHWERPNGHQPSMENLVGIARHLSISLEWLAIGRGERVLRGSSGSEPNVISLSADEEALVKRYKDLPSPSRTILVQFIEALNPSSEATDKVRGSRI